MRWIKIISIATCVITTTLLHLSIPLAGMTQAFQKGIEGDWAAAKSSFNSLAEQKEKKIKHVAFELAIKNFLDVGFYRALEEVASDALEDKLPVKEAKELMKAGQLASIGQIEQAIVLTHSSLLNLQSYPFGHFLLGRLYLINCVKNRRNCGLYLQEYQTTLRNEPDFIYALMDLGFAQAHNRKHYNAVKTFRKVSVLTSNDTVKAMAHLNLTFQYVLLKKWALANENMENATSLGVIVPNNVVRVITQSSYL
jgi:hypothetical protein